MVSCRWSANVNLHNGGREVYLGSSGPGKETAETARHAAPTPAHCARRLLSVHNEDRARTPSHAATRYRDNAPHLRRCAGLRAFQDPAGFVGATAQACWPRIGECLADSTTPTATTPQSFRKHPSATIP